MKQITKAIYSLALVMLGIVAVNAQDSNGNLFKNGDFTNGSTDGWNLGKDFHITSESGYYYATTNSYVGKYAYPRISTDKQEVTIIPGATYTFSVWGKGLSSNEFKANFLLQDSNGKSVTLKGVKDVNYNTFNLSQVEDQGSWKKFEKVITFPENVDVVKLTSFGITLTGDNKGGKGLSEIHMVKTADPKPKAPENFKVADGMLFQRSAGLTWDKVDGETYKVEVNGQMYEVASGENTLYVNGLVPNTEYTAMVYTTENPEAKASVKFKTSNYIKENEEERVPFLADVVGNQVSKTFMYHIDDLTGTKITNVEVMYGGKTANVKDGVVTLPEGVNQGDLVIKVTQDGGEVTTINYNSITKKQ